MVAKEIFGSAQGLPVELDSFFEFPTVWDYMGYIGNWLVSFFLGFVIIYMITSEVTNKTMRQNIINGHTRKDYFLGKLYTLLAFSTVATLIYVISTFIIGVAHTDGWDMELVFDTNLAPLKFFLMCMGYLSFAMLIAFWIRRSGLAIFFYLIYVMMLEVILRYIQVYFWQHESMKWWPMNTVEDLLPNPFFKFGDQMVKTEYDFAFLLSDNQAIIGTIIYTCIFLGLSWYNFSKRDV